MDESALGAFLSSLFVHLLGFSTLQTTQDLPAWGTFCFKIHNQDSPSVVNDCFFPVLARLDVSSVPPRQINTGYQAASLGYVKPKGVEC